MIKKNIKEIVYILSLVLSFVFLPAISSAEAPAYSKTGLNIYNVNLQASLSNAPDKKVYKAGDVLRADLRLDNLGKYCLLDGKIVYSLTVGSGSPVVPPNALDKAIDSENVIQEETLSTVVCPGKPITQAVKISLPKDLRGGDYRMDFYLLSARLPISGNHATYSPMVYLPFKIASSTGDFPQAKIVRSKTRFAGEVYQAGPVVEAGSKQTSFVFIANEDIKNSFTGKLLTTICTSDEFSGLGCRELGEQNIIVPPGLSKSFGNNIDLNFLPDVYSIYYRLIDEAGRSISNYSNRFIVKGHEASIGGLALDKLSYIKGDKINIQASVGGPYTYGYVPTFTVKDISLKAELFDQSGIFEQKIFSKTQNYAVINSDSEVGFYGSLTAGSNISGYKLCLTLSDSSKTLDTRCVSAGQNNSIFSWPVFYLFIGLMILLILLVLWRVSIWRGKNLAASHLIIFFSLLISLTNVARAGVANQFQSQIPGDDRFTSSDIPVATNPAHTPCAAIDFYYDQNNDDVAQASEKINLFRGADDGLYYVPKNTIAHLFRPVFDDPTVTSDYTNPVTHEIKHHTLAADSPYRGCVGLPVGWCQNGSPVGIAYWPTHLMDVTKSVAGPAPTFTSNTTYTLSVTKQAIIDAINANTYTDGSFTTHTAITPALTSADVPNLATLISGGDLSLLDSYIGMDQLTTAGPPHPYPAGQIFTNYKTRCEATNPQASNALPNVAAAEPDSLAASFSELKNTLLSAVFSIGNFSLFNIDTKSLLAAFSMSVVNQSPSLVTGASPVSDAIGDFNGDNLMDIVTANATGGTLSVFIQNSGVNRGTFAVPITLTAGSAPYSVAIGDLNGDNKQDIAAVNNGSRTVSVFINNGNNTFTPLVSPPGTGGAPISLAIADMNNDGHPDLIVSNNYNGAIDAANPTLDRVSVILNSNPSTSWPVVTPTYSARTDYLTQNGTPPTGAGPRPAGIAVADLNNDGRKDIVVTDNNTSQISVFLQNAIATPGTYVRTDYPSTLNPFSVAIGNLDGIGNLDMAVSDNGSGTNNKVSAFINNGGASGIIFNTRADYSTGVSTGLAQHAVAIGDLDGDAKQDLAVVNNFNGTNGNSVSVLLGNGNGTFGTNTNYAVGVSPIYVAIGDLNGDGKNDMAVTNSFNGTNGNSVSVLLVSLTAAAPPNAPPSAPTVTSIGNTQVSLSWSAPQADTTYGAATGYYIYATDNQGNTLPRSSLIAGTSGTFTGLTNDTKSYTFKITANNSWGEGLPSAASTPAVTPTDPCAASPITPNASPKSGTLTTTDCSATINGTAGHFVDRYSFSGVAGQRVTITMATGPYPATTFYNTWLNLLDSTGVTIIAQNDNCNISIGGLATNCAGTGDTSNSVIYNYILPTTGNYTIVAAPYLTGSSNSATGPYTLSLSMTAAAPPNAPSSAPTVTSIGNTQVSLSWSAPQADTTYGAATGYYIYTTDNLANTTKSSLIAGTSGTVTGLINDTKSYTFKITANNSWGEGLPSAASTPAVTPTDPCSKITVISFSTPINGSLVSGDCTSTHGFNNAHGYSDLYSFSAAAGQKITINQTNTSGNGKYPYMLLYNATDLTYATQLAYGDGLNSLFPVNYVTPGTPASANYIIIASTWGAGDTFNYTLSLTTPGVFVPNTPAKPVPSLANGGAVSLTWAAPSFDGTTHSAATGYYVYSSADNYVNKINSTPVTSPYVVTGLTNNTAYTFKVSGNNNAGEGSKSLPSDPINVISPPNIPAVPTTAPGNNQATITWVAPLADTNHGSATSYKIYRNTINNPVSASDVTASCSFISAVSCNNTGLSNNNVYYFFIKAINAGGDLGLSQGGMVSLYPSPSAPVLSATPGDTQAVLNWTVPAGTVTGYKVYRGATAGFSLSGLAPIATITTTSYTDNNLVNNPTTPYYYKVTAVNVASDSSPSNEVPVTPIVLCSVTVNASSAAQTVVTANGTTYYINLAGARGYLWTNGLITSTTQNTYTYPPGTKLDGSGVLDYKFTASGFYNLYIRDDKSELNSFTGNVAWPPGAFDAQFGDRRPH